MKLKKYNEFVNEELTPISSESELLETPEEIEAEEIIYQLLKRKKRKKAISIMGLSK